MYRSKEKLLESVDETESVLSTYRSRLQGLTNRSFDYTTESSLTEQTRNPRIKVENVEVYQTEDNNPKPVPLPRSRIPKLVSKDESSKKTRKLKELKRDKQSEDDGSASVPLATFVVNNEKRKQNTRKSKTVEESSIITTTEDASSTYTKTEDQESIEPAPAPEKNSKKHRKKKLIGQRMKSKDSKDSEDATATNTSSIGIYVHDLDFLKFTFDLESVHVRVSLYDQSNGNLLTTSSKSDPKELQPLVTKSCRFLNASYLHCIWEELLLFEENPRILKKENSIIFFEIVVRLETLLDFKPIAWAFLKPFQEGKFDNLEKRLKLQVYHYHKKMNIFQNWQNNKNHSNYPSTLTITLKALQRTLHNTPDRNDSKEEINTKDPFDVSGLGLSHKTFKRPNQVVSSLNLSGKGTNCIKLNHNGDILAITNPSEDGASKIIICTVPDLKIVQRLEGHSDFIYDIQWKSGSSKYPQTLMSCSADRTLLIWNIQKDYSYTVNVIPHVTFIYCCQFWTHQGQDVIITAGKDSIVRIWQPFKGTFKIFQELSKGTGYISSMVAKGPAVYTGNSEGRVMEWKWIKNSFEFSRVIYEDQGLVSHLELHPRIEKIFIGKGTGEIVCLDLESPVIIQRFEMGHQERSMRFFKFRVSNCGMYLLAVGGGPEIHCWNILTGFSEDAFDFIKRPLGNVYSAIDLPRKGSFVILGRYMANKGAVMLVNNSDATLIPARPSIGNVDVGLSHSEEAKGNRTTTAVKNKLSEIIEKLDQVLILPQLCDDEKINLSKDMVNEKRRIEEWLDRNVTPRNQSAVEEESDCGTFVVERQGSIKSNGTYTVEDEQKPKPHRRILRQQDKVSSDEDGNKDNCGTYEIKRKKDTDADDTSVSDSVFG